ncbi:hypothetical protein HNR12_003047 [Streptomonospora nanhaiensis]|uniref:Interferon-induced transmembrane protein n=1 Tax=Streptomonospora nanhaiensis TaxID=1323731 RepID=A0A853BP44_9ACTN|nr:hypothetical protein [Streptomonospora nanhaiensis]
MSNHSLPPGASSPRDEPPPGYRARRREAGRGQDGEPRGPRDPSGTGPGEAPGAGRRDPGGDRPARGERPAAAPWGGDRAEPPAPAPRPAPAPGGRAEPPEPPGARPAPAPGSPSGARAEGGPRWRPADDRPAGRPGSGSAPDTRRADRDPDERGTDRDPDRAADRAEPAPAAGASSPTMALILHALTFLCCANWIFGVIGIVFAVRAGHKRDQGRYAEAETLTRYSWYALGAAAVMFTVMVVMSLWLLTQAGSLFEGVVGVGY